ncbi:MAG: glycosyltransferase [Candidatus Lokiarchaeota archaeon]|nr:glycosyltransferase [Candidatus Lokiarchaeota archaeon]
MIFFHNFINLVNWLLDFIKNPNTLIFIFVFIILYNLILITIFDKKALRLIKSFQSIRNLTLKDLKTIPKITFVIPAWNENERLDEVLRNLKNLNYPKFEVILNAGGNSITNRIADSYKTVHGFTILKQKKGKGKIRAINDCLKYVQGGLVYIIDADVIISDELLLNMIFQIINKDEDIVVSAPKPHKNIRNKDLVKYLYMTQNPEFRKNPSQLAKTVGPNTIYNYNVIKTIGKFSEGIYSDDNLVIAEDLFNYNYHIFYLRGYLGEFYIASTVSEYLNQNIRWIGNSYLRKKRKRKRVYQLKFFLYFFLSIYIYIFPIFAFIHITFFWLYLFLLVQLYSKRIRKIIFFKKLTKDYNFIKTNTVFYLKIFFYIYLESLAKILAAIEIIFLKKKYKKRKNLD